MNLQFLDQPFLQRLVGTISWTLAHSLWQGFILVILVAVTLLFTVKSRPQLRYHLLCALLLLFVLASVCTFWIEFNRQPAAESAPDAIRYSSIPTLKSEEVLSENSFNFGKNHDIMSWLSHFFDHNASVITMLWLMVFMIKSANIAVGIFHLKSIKRNSSTIISEQWIEHFDRLALRLGISGKVLLAQSGQITSPIVLGIFKPIVLIPLGFLTELPVDQVEAILLHELAHIKRRDYLVNLLQSVAENIFFFNPAIFWLSKLIREERECCCDDLAISALDNKSSFVRALVSYQEYRIASQDEIVAFTGKNNHLFYRIKRIIVANYNKPVNAMEKIFIATCLVTTITLTAAFSTVKTEKTVKIEEVISMNSLSNKQQKKPTALKPASSFVSDTNTVVTLKYTPVDSLPLLKELSPETLEAKKRLDELTNEIHRLWKESNKRWDLIMDSRKQTVVSKLRSEAFRNQNGTSEILEGKIDPDKHHVERPSVSDEKQHQLNVALDKMRNVVLQMDSMLVKEKTEKARLMENEHEKIYGTRNELRLAASKTYRQKLRDELISDLIRTGIARDKENLSFKLHNKFLIVNGVTQPENIQKEFKAKYLEDDWHEWLYNFEGKSGYVITGVRYPI